jgi:hypothetical protein
VNFDLQLSTRSTGFGSIQTDFGWVQAWQPACAIVTQFSLKAILCHYSLSPGEPARLATKKAPEFNFLLGLREG